MTDFHFKEEEHPTVLEFFISKKWVKSLISSGQIGVGGRRGKLKAV